MRMRHLKFLALAAASLLLAAASPAATVEARDIPSRAMNKTIPAVIAIPDAYVNSTGTYPVVYLLHGFGGNYTSWVQIAPIGELADRYGVLIVCPEGADSWYFDIPADPNYLYETYISGEVVAYMDENFRTVASPAGRAIAGLSMGGHGAMYLALRHKDVFGAAGSMSGGLDIRPFPKNWNLSKRLGKIEENPAEWEARTAINNLSGLQNGELALIIDCGIKDFFLSVNRKFHEALLKEGIDHDYTERPGAHNAAYWKNAVEYQMLFFHDFFGKAQASGN